MKKIIIILLTCVSCGKTAMDAPITKQSSALLSPKEQKLIDCKTQAKWQYNECMKMFSPYDPVDVRQARLSACENQILATQTAHCDYCDSVDWDIAKPEVFRWPDSCTTCPWSGKYCNGFVSACTPTPATYKQCLETDYTYHPYL